jgi:hypothetical protein
MAGAKAVEKVQKRQAAFDGRKVRYQGDILGLLNRVGCQQGKSGLADGHDVLMVAKNREGVGGNGASGYMQHAGQALAAHLEHVRDHQQQALGGGKAAG